MNNIEFIKKLNTEILFLSRKMFGMFGVQYEINDINNDYIMVLVCMPEEYHTTKEKISRNVKKSIKDFYPNIPVDTFMFKFIDLEKWNDPEAKKLEIESDLACRIIISDDERLIKTYSKNGEHFMEIGLGT